MNAPLVVIGSADLPTQNMCFDGYIECYFVSDLANPQDLYGTIPENIKTPFRDVVLRYLNTIPRGDGLKADCKKLIARVESEMEISLDHSNKEKIALFFLLNAVRSIKIDL